MLNTYSSRAIGSIAKVKGGKRLPPNMGVQDEETVHPYLRVVDFGDDGVDRSNLKFISNETHEHVKRYTISSDDVYVSIAGTIGRVGIVPDDLSGANLTENAAKITEINGQVDKRYLLYFLRSARGQGALQNKAGGTSQPKLALFRIEEIEFPCPPVEQQTHIADLLATYDDLIENNRRRMTLLEESARLLYREWFVRLRFPGYEHTPIVDSVPQGWERVRVDDLGTVLTGKTPSTKDADNYGGDIPFVKTPDMHGNAFVLQAETYLTEKGAKSQANKFLPPGALLVSCIGTVGVVSLTSELCQFNQQINAVIPGEDFLRYYSYFALKEMKPRLDAIGGGVTMANVSKGKFESMDVLRPASALLRNFDEFSSPVFNQIKVLGQQNQKLRAARDLLLPRLMSGELAV